MCLISIIIPVYNVEEYLEQCLDSIVNQNLKDIEIICVDDGSTDNSLEILEKFSSKDKRIKVFSKENGGQASARNLGIKKAKGEYIAFVDSDDFIKEDMFAKLYNLANANDLDLAMCKVALYDENTGNINKNAWYYKLGVFEKFNKDIFNHNDTHEFTCNISVTPYNKIYKTSLLKENNILFPEGLIFEDEKFFYDVYLRAEKISVLDDFLYYYRINRKGSTVDISKENNYTDMVPIYKLIRQTFEETGDYENYKVLLANRLIHLEFSRFTQTAEKYKEQFFNEMKEDLSEVLKDELIYDNLSLNIKSRVYKLLNSKDYGEFKELDKNKEFSVIIACNNSERFLEETVNTVLNQSFSFESNIQLIFVDVGSTDGTADICKNYERLYPDNVIYIYQKGSNLSKARNEGLKYATGKYVNFLEYMDKFKGDTFEYVYSFFQKNSEKIDLVSIPVLSFDQDHSRYPFNSNYSDNRIVNLNQSIDDSILFVNSVFFKREVLEKYGFNTDLTISEGSLLINQVLLEKLAYGFVSEGTYWYRKRDNLFFRDHILSNKDYYLKRLDYFTNLAEQSKMRYGFVQMFIQHLFLFELDIMFKVENIHEILSNDEIEELYSIIQNILNFIEDDVILSLKNDNSNLRYHFLAIKYGCISIDNDGTVSCNNLISRFSGNSISIYCKHAIIDRLDDHDLDLDEIRLNNNVLYISGSFVSLFNNDEISIEALKINNGGNEEVFKADISVNRENNVFLGYEFESSINFNFEIPLGIDEDSIIKLQVVHKEFSSLCNPYFLNLNIHDDSFKRGFVVENGYRLIRAGNHFKVISHENYIKNSFSVVMACYNSERYLEETIESILNQTFSFKNNIQLILVDDGSVDSTADICKKYVDLYPDDVLYIYQENQGQGAARNHGLKYATGKYVNFLDSDDKFREDTFKNVFDFFEKHYDEIDLVSVSVDFFDREHGSHPLNYKYWKSQVLDIRKKIDYPQLFANSAFFKRDLFEKFHFDTELVNSEDALIINQILLEKMAYGLVKEGKYWYRKRQDESSTIDRVKFKKEFYLDRLNNYFKRLIDDSLKKYGEVHKFIQYLIVYDLQWMFRVSDIGEILSPLEINDVYNAIKDVLNYVEDDVILKLRNDDSNLRNHMLAIKHSNIHVDIRGNIECTDIYSEFNGDYLGIYSGNVLVDRLDIHKFGIDIIEIRENNLFISGYLYSFINNEDISIEAIKLNKNGLEEVFKAKETYYPNREKKFLGCVTESSFDFDLKIPLNSDEDSIIKLQVRYIGDESLDLSYQLDINFNDYARLSKKSNYSVWGNYILEYVNNDFIVTNYSYSKMIKKEIPILKYVLSSKEPFYTSIFAFRLVYLLLYPFYKNKRIWLFMDRRESADDNAEHLFKYAIKQNDGIKKYFTVSKGSDDYNRLSKLGNILPFYSIKQRLIYLFAEKIISSHPDEIILNPFMGKNIGLYCSLITSEKIFLQHGVTKDNISSWLRKYDKNLSLLVTVSDLETESFFEEGYNYDKHVVQTLGFPRFDNLIDINDEKDVDSNKQIIIMPSWREELVGKTNNQIKVSDYFIKINSLINNEQLINAAKELGYKILFKPHPLVYKFIHLFDKNDYVFVDNETKYQDLFKSSDLMITDYSSVAFDFSYMKKPVIYYQYADDYNFKNGYFDYETMGFGEVINDEKELIDTIIEYMENDCCMKEEYKNRVNRFYKYDDKNNCKRVYDAILNIKHD